MFVEQIRTGGDRNFAYLVADEETKDALVIDPSYWPEGVVDFARDHGYTIRYVINTHRHPDHTNGNETVKQQTGVEALAFQDTDPATGKRIEDGTELPLGTRMIRILHTPGHTPDSVCLLVDDSLFTGDMLFVGKIGGTDFAEGARTQYRSLHEKLLTLPDDTRVYPGHDVGTAPTTTIGEEKRTNPFLLCEDLTSFIDLKKNWLEYKREHGIN